MAKKHQQSSKSHVTTTVSVDTPYSFKPNRWIYLVLMFGWAFMLRAPIAHIPLDRDEGEYAYIAQRSLIGEVPYKTSFDQKPPGTFLIYALIERYIGTSPAAIHWGTQIYSLGTLVLVFFLGEKLFSGFVGAIAAFLLALMMADPSVVGNSSNTETFMLLPLIGSLYATLIATEKNSLLWSVISGLLLGTSCLFKQVALINAGFIVIYLFFKSHRQFASPLSAVAGIGIVFSLIALYFYTVGAWKEFYDCIIGYNLRYSSLVPLDSYLENFWRTFRPHLLSFWPIYLFSLLGAMGGLRQSSIRMLTGWLLFSLGGVVTGGFFRGHYYIEILPAIALLAAGGMHLLLQERLGGRVVFTSITIAIMALGFAIWRNFWFFGPGDPDAKARKMYGKNPFVESQQVGQYLAKNSNPTDSIFVFGSEPQILYYADRPSASRYIYVYPLMAGDDPIGREQQVILDLHTHQPKFIVAVFANTSFGDSSGFQPIFGDLYSLLTQSYQIAAVVPNPNTGSVQIIEGPPAQEMWNKNPFWYSGRPWCSLAIWQRKATIAGMVRTDVTQQSPDD